MKKLHVSTLIILIACIAAFAVLAFVEGPKIITTQVKGLQLEQDGTEITATWKDMDCQEYNVSVTCEGKTTTVSSIKENSYGIQNVIPDKVYTVSVEALLNSSKLSRAAEKSITAEKLKQDLGLDLEQLNGLRGDKYQLNVTADMPVQYTSSNEKVATVSENGNISMLKPGRTKVTVELVENGLYEGVSQEVEVNVYPESLKQTTLKISEKTDTSVTFTWDRVGFAQGYKLLKYNLAKDKYVSVKKFANDETTYEMARDAGKYKIEAYVDAIEQTIKSTSDSVEVTSISANAPSYGSIHVVSTIDQSDVRVLTYLTGNQSSRNPQSLCYTGKNYVVAFSNRSSSSGRLEAYNAKGKAVDGVNTSSISHANGMTYNPNTGKIYVMRTYAGHRIKSIATFDGETLDQTDSVSTRHAPSGIAYDESNNKYYMSAGPRLYVSNGDMGLEKTIGRKRWHTSQDMSAYNGVAMSCIWSGGMSSYIDMYRASDSAYIGSISVTLGEIESVVVVDGHFAILVNVPGSSRDALYITKDRVKMPK